MFTKLLALIPGIVLASQALAWAPFDISHEKVLGDCADLRIEESADGGYVLVADFTDVFASAEGPSTRDYSYCNVQYTINLHPGYTLRQIDTSVEGYYSVDVGGKVIVGVENRVVGTTKTVARRFLFNQATELSDLNGVVGSIRRADLPLGAQRPGASIPLNTKYTVEAVQSAAALGLTDVRLTTAVAGARSYPICKIYLTN